MPTKIISIILCLFVGTTLFAQKRVSQSNLPIIIIESPLIPSEPKVTATMSIIDNGKDSLNRINDPFNGYEGQIGIELRGQSSLSLFPKKSYGLETRDSLGENLNVSLLGLPKENDWVLHGPYSDKSLMRNALAYIIAGRLMEYAPRVRFVELIINDAYQGIYLFTEKIKRDKNRVNIQRLTDTSEDITGGYIIKFDKGNEIGWTSPYPSIANRSPQTNFLYHTPKIHLLTTPQKEYIQNFVTSFEDVLQSDDFADSENGYSKYIDPATFIDYLLVNEISKNVDGYRLSTYMYKDIDAIDGRLKKGPVWDFNLAFGNANYCNGESNLGWGYDFNTRCPDDFWVIHFWWKRLLEDLAFKNAVKERWKTLRQSTLSDDAVIGIIDSLENLLVQENAVARNFQEWDVLQEWVWPNAVVANTYTAEVDYLRNWVKRRISWLDVQFDSFTNVPDNPASFKEQISVYPNPTNSAIQFDFTIQRFTRVTLRIYNSMGQLVHQQLIEEIEQSQEFQYNWQTSTKGVYFYTVDTFADNLFDGTFIVVE